MKFTTQHLFCPVAMACEMLEPRWTMLVLCELWNGSSRFNDIQRGVPAMSPSMLSRRLKDMEFKGLVHREKSADGGRYDYFTTPVADKLKDLVYRLGEWAYENIEADIELSNLDAKFLMWNIRRKINTLELPKRKVTIQFIIHNPPEETTNYWLISKPDTESDLCFSDPGLNVDLFLTCNLESLSAAWIGQSNFDREIRDGRITLIGSKLIGENLSRWLHQSAFASNAKRSLKLLAGTGSAGTGPDIVDAAQ